MMRRMVGHLTVRTCLLATPLMLAGCGPLISFGDNGPADDIYALRYDGDYAGTGGQPPLIYVDDPFLAEGLAGNKVAVRLDGGKRSSLMGARWSAVLSQQVRDYMVRSMGAETSTTMVAEGALDLRLDCRLNTKVWEFDYVPGSAAGDDKVQMAFELSLVRLRDARLVSQQTFTQTTSVAGSGHQAVMQGFNSGMKALTGQMTAWLAREKAACGL